MQLYQLIMQHFLIKRPTFLQGDKKTYFNMQQGMQKGSNVLIILLAHMPVRCNGKNWCFVLPQHRIHYEKNASTLLLQNEYKKYDAI